ncbi:MAG: hypothetical protein KBT21_11410 [Treponema sp.]|nr:hypothetical protein [Candidatus Treponema merdequi]
MINNKQLETAYKNWLNNTEKCNSPIPHIIHHIWLGSKLPDQYKPFIETFKKYNPDWQFILWDEEKILSLQNFTSKKDYLTASNYGMKSDIARYAILKEYGGFYFDTDFECLKNLSPISDKSSFISCLQFTDKIEFGNAMIACCAHHPLIEKISSSIKGINSSDILEIINTTGPGFLTNMIMNNISTITEFDALLPAEYFFAVPNSEKADVRAAKHRYITDNSYAIHYWESSWFQNDLFHRLVRKLKKIFSK